jgi:hypothetical protein
MSLVLHAPGKKRTHGGHGKMSRNHLISPPNPNGWAIPLTEAIKKQAIETRTVVVNCALFPPPKLFSASGAFQFEGNVSLLMLLAMVFGLSLLLSN